MKIVCLKRMAQRANYYQQQVVSSLFGGRAAKSISRISAVRRPAAALVRSHPSGSASASHRRFFRVTRAARFTASEHNESRSATAEDGDNVLISRARLDELLEAEILKFAAEDVTPLTFFEIYSLENEFIEEFLKRELPTRYATRLKLIESLPGWQLQKNLKHVRKVYSDSFKRLRNLQAADSDRFFDFIEGTKKRHASIVPHVISGVADMFDKNALDNRRVDRFMSAFFQSRIGTESLTNHFLQLQKSQHGIIDPDCDLLAILKEAADEAVEMCRMHYPKLYAKRSLNNADEGARARRHCTPRIEIRNHSPATASENVAFVPEYFHYISFEILKNSLRAVAENNQNQEPIGSPANGEDRVGARRAEASENDAEHEIGRESTIYVDLSCSASTITLRISDEGGGIPRTQLRKVWSYLYTTAKPVTDFHSSGTGAGSSSASSDGLDSAASSSEDGRSSGENVVGESPGTTSIGSEEEEMLPMAGFGCGLPLTQAYLNWVGGDIQLVSLPTFGTDVYVKITRPPV
ncbi:unnamed protein product [Amoebophrya sp. A120]|nr:unnamed protein product [Amoebophrya sp. A120]|eukprot:GSA120T00022637001.1